MTTATEDPTRAADATLSDVALAMDYLLAVPPVDVPEAWKRFHAGRYRVEPTFRYRPLAADIERWHARLAALALDGNKCVIDPNVDVNETASIVLEAKRGGGRQRVDLDNAAAQQPNVDFDVLALDDSSYVDRPFAERRSRLEQALADTPRR